MNYSDETKFASDMYFSKAILSRLTYTNPKDNPSISAIWHDEKSGSVFTIPISAFKAGGSELINLIEKARCFDEPYTGVFNFLEIKLNGKFLNDDSELSFEIEVR